MLNQCGMSRGDTFSRWEPRWSEDSPLLATRRRGRDRFIGSIVVAAALIEATAALSSRPSRLSRTGVVWCRLIPHPYIETPLWLGPVDNSWFSIGWKHTTPYPLAFHLFSNPEGNQRVLSLLIYLSIVTLLDFNVILCQMLLKLLLSQSGVWQQIASLAGAGFVNFLFLFSLFQTHLSSDVSDPGVAI